MIWGNGGILMFALFALAGDVGCSMGPTVVGIISSGMNDNLKMGIFSAIVFPVIMLLGIFLYYRSPKSQVPNKDKE